MIKKRNKTIDKKYNMIEICNGIGYSQLAIKKTCPCSINTLFISEWSIYSIIGYASLHFNKEYQNNKKDILSKLSKDDYSEYQDKLMAWLYDNYSENNIPTLTLDGNESVYRYEVLKFGIIIHLIAALKTVNNHGYIKHINCKQYNGVVDIMWHSSPCEFFHDIDITKYRKTNVKKIPLLYDTYRVIKETNPNIVVWENMIGEVDMTNLKDFNNYLVKMDKINYTNFYLVIEGVRTTDFPQLRNRFFAISIKNDYSDKRQLIEIVLNIIKNYSKTKLYENGYNNGIKPFKNNIRGDEFFFTVSINKEKLKIDTQKYIENVYIKKTKKDTNLKNILKKEKKNICKEVLKSNLFIVDNDFERIMGLEKDTFKTLKKEVPESNIIHICGNGRLVNEIKEFHIDEIVKEVLEKNKKIIK